jgi:hypothetical protein
MRWTSEVVSNGRTQALLLPVIGSRALERALEKDG